jgi:hypothetical protein
MSQLVVPPICSRVCHLCLPEKNFFLPPEKSVCHVRLWLTHQLHIKNNFDMKKQLPTQDALVNIFHCKSHNFLYVIKKANSETWLPRLPKAVVKDMIQSPGLYQIIYRLYKNEKGYESLFIHSAVKVMTS